MIKIILNGAGGRMGKTISGLIEKDPTVTLAAAVDIHEGNGIAADLKDAAKKGDVILDFSNAAATPSVIEAALHAKRPIVIGTTGQTAEQKGLILKASKEVPVILSPNMSVGVNLVYKLTEIASKIIGADHNISLTERHHIHKKDAPSGTAKKLVEIIQKNTGTEKITNEKVTAIREGEIVGDHILVFENATERFEMSHRALTREIFAQGAIRAAKWIVDKKSGMYDMQDVLFKI